MSYLNMKHSFKNGIKIELYANLLVIHQICAHQIGSWVSPELCKDQAARPQTPPKQ